MDFKLDYLRYFISSLLKCVWSGCSSNYDAAWGTQFPYLCTWAGILASIRNPAFCWRAPWDRRWQSSRWLPSVPVREPGWVPSFWLWPGPACAHVGVCRVKHQMGALSLLSSGSVSVCASQTQGGMCTSRACYENAQSVSSYSYKI